MPTANGRIRSAVSCRVDAGFTLVAWPPGSTSMTALVMPAAGRSVKPGTSVTIASFRILATAACISLRGSGLPGRIGGFGYCPHPFQSDPHAVEVGAAARKPGHHPVQAQDRRVGQFKRLGDLSSRRAGLQLVAPRVHGHPTRPGHREGELATRIARHHRAGSPVHRPPAVAPDMTAETRPHCRPADAAEPFRLKRLGTELPDPGDVTDQVPDPVSGCRHMNRDRTTHHLSVRGPPSRRPPPSWHQPLHPTLRTVSARAAIVRSGRVPPPAP